MKKETIFIIAQGWYGNRTGTEIRKNEVDEFIYNNSTTGSEESGRAVIRFPETENVVLVYNKYAEEERLTDKERYYREDGYVLKPLAFIPELNVKLYSRCIVCRMDEAGEFFSLQDGDWDKIEKYLAP